MKKSKILKKYGKKRYEILTLHDFSEREKIEKNLAELMIKLFDIKLFKTGGEKFVIFNKKTKSYE